MVPCGRNISLVVSGVYYILLGIWWHLQISKKYWSCKQKKIEFSSSVTFNCCIRCRYIPVEGLLKLVGSLSICTISIYQINNANNTSEKNEAVGQLTVFCLFVLSSVCDIISDGCNRVIFPGLDYLLLVVGYNIQSVVLSYHSVLSDSWLAIADTCAMYVATFAAIALLLEFKYSHYVWFPVMRSFCTLVLGTWFAHMYIVLLNQNLLSTAEQQALSTNILSTDEQHGNNFTTTVDNSITTETVAQDIQSTEFVEENLMLVPMYFLWHCLFNMNLLTILWVVTWKLASKNCCICMPDEERVNQFENRVHFDYHMISRMTDSDYDD